VLRLKNIINLHFESIIISFFTLSIILSLFIFNKREILSPITVRF